MAQKNHHDSVSSTAVSWISLAPTASPGSIEDFVDHVVPLLQRRGICRTVYEGETFRENSMA